jgi:iron complex transport system substrate-binding protein
MSRIRRRQAVSSLLIAIALLLSACSGAATPASTAAPIVVPAPTPAPTSAPTPAPMATAAATPAAATPAPTAAYPLTLTDDEGTSVTLAAQPKRIVSLTPAATETLFALGVGDQIVGRSEDPNPHPAAAATIPALTNMGAVDVEKIVSLTPDVVIAGGLGFTPSDAIKKLRSLKIPVLVIYAPDVAGVLADVRLTARTAGVPAAGEALAAAMKDDLDAVSAAATGAAAGSTPPRVFYEIDATKEIYGPADNSFLAEMIRLAGGSPITTGSPDVYSIPLERLVAADPQIILLGDAAYGTTPAQVAGRAGWGGLAAAMAGAIRPIDDVMVTRPGPRLADGLRTLALAINPAAVLPTPAPVPAAPPAETSAP